MNKVLWQKSPKKLLASRSELHIWKIELDVDPTLYNALIAQLSPREIEGADSFVFEEGRRRQKISYAMKRLVLAEYLQLSPTSLDFESNEYGKSFISASQNSLGLQFNVSHSGNLIVIAVTIKDPVGIDVEYHKQNFSEEELVARIFSKKDQSFFFSLDNAKEKKKVFYRGWTRKEAYLKALGVGLVDNLQSISVDLNEVPNDDWLYVPEELVVETTWKLFSLDLGQDYTTAVVATTYQKQLFCYDVRNLIVN